MKPWTLEGLRAQRDALLAIAEKRGARNVRVFGSVALGQADAESDVDLLVDFDPGRSLLDHGGLIADLEEFLHCRVDVVTARALRDRARSQITSEALPL
jgi:predicted nucleotidyltransferase